MEIFTEAGTLVLSGDLDVRCTGEVRAALHAQLDRFDEVVVDLTDVRSVDVTALKVLAVASRRAHHEDKRLRLRGCNGAVRRMLHLTHLIRLVEVERQRVPA